MPMGSGTSTPRRLSGTPENSRTRKNLSECAGNRASSAAMCPSVMAKIWVASLRIASETGRLLKPSSEAPRFFNRLRVSGLAAYPLVAATPAELAVMSWRPATALRNSPSAIGLRQVFPVQTKRTCFNFDIAADSEGAEAIRQIAMPRACINGCSPYAAAQMVEELPDQIGERLQIAREKADLTV